MVKFSFSSFRHFVLFLVLIANTYTVAVNRKKLLQMFHLFDNISIYERIRIESMVIKISLNMFFFGF